MPVVKPKPDVAGWTVVNSEYPLTIEITERHVKNAVCKDPAKCVIAQALREHYQYAIEGFQVGSNITKLIFGNKVVVRYSTPSNLGHSLRVFDDIGEWKLPPGKYTLLPIAKKYKAASRWESARRNGGVQSTFRGIPAAPTRHAETVCQIIKKRK